MRLIRVEIVKINRPENMFQRFEAQFRAVFLIGAVLLKKGVAFLEIGERFFRVAAVMGRLPQCKTGNGALCMRFENCFFSLSTIG